MAMPSDNFDYQAEQDALLRRQKLLQVMQQQAMQTPVVGTSNGLGQALAKMGQMYFNHKADQQITDRQTKLADQRQTGLAAGLKDYMNTQNGMAGSSPPDELGGGPPSPDIPPDPQAALLKAMTSRYPELQQIGAMQMKSNIPEIKDVNGQVIATNAFKGTAKKIGDFRSPLQAGDQFFDASDPTKKVGDARTKFGPITEVGKDPQGRPIQAQVAEGTNKNEYPPAGQTINVDTKGESAAMTEAGKNVLPTLQGARESIISADNMMKQGKQFEALAKDPEVITGAGAGPIGALNALATKLGFTGPGAATKTQELLNQQAQATLGKVKQLTGAISDKEGPFLATAAAGKLDWTPQAIEHMALVQQAVAHNLAVNSSNLYFSTLKFPGAQEVSTMAPLPNWSHSLDPNKFDTDEQNWMAQPKLPFMVNQPAVPASAAAGWTIKPVQ